MKTAPLRRTVLVVLALFALPTFGYDPPPAVTAISPVLANAGASVTITGANFDATAANNAVFFGAMKGTVTTASTT